MLLLAIIIAISCGTTRYFSLSKEKAVFYGIKQGFGVTRMKVRITANDTVNFCLFRLNETTGTLDQQYTWTGIKGTATTIIGKGEYTLKFTPKDVVIAGIHEKYFNGIVFGISVMVFVCIVGLCGTVKLSVRLCKEYDYKRNKWDPIDLVYSSSKKVWWICSKNSCGCHKWEAAIKSRTNIKYKSGCPYCSNKKVCEHNNFAVLYPMLYVEWDYTKNELNPYKLLPKSYKRVHWRCSKNNICYCHRWTTRLGQRVSKHIGCPHCAGKKICPHNSLQAKYPEIAKEFDSKRNKITPDKVSPHSSKKYYWICNKNVKTVINGI